MCVFLRRFTKRFDCSEKIQKIQEDEDFEIRRLKIMTYKDMTYTDNEHGNETTGNLSYAYVDLARKKEALSALRHDTSILRKKEMKNRNLAALLSVWAFAFSIVFILSGCFLMKDKTALLVAAGAVFAALGIVFLVFLFRFIIEIRSYDDEILNIFLELIKTQKALEKLNKS